MGSSPTLGANLNLKSRLQIQVYFAGVAELADAQDLKSCAPYRAYRFDPGLRHQSRKHLLVQQIIYCRGVEQLVARRAHNPEAEGSSPSPATKKMGYVRNPGAFDIAHFL